MRILICVSMLAGLTAAAWGQERDAGLSVYQQIMRTQYAARQRPLPARPEESQKIYDTYLRSIGKPAPAQTDDTSSNSANPSH